MKCIHEWRVFGTRIDEEVYPVYPDQGSVICTKCDIEQSATYEVIENRPFPKNYTGFDRNMGGGDTIVKIKEWQIFRRDVAGVDKSGKLYTKESFIWDVNNEQWVKDMWLKI